MGRARGRCRRDRPRARRLVRSGGCPPRPAPRRVRRRRRVARHAPGGERGRQDQPPLLRRAAPGPATAVRTVIRRVRGLARRRGPTPPAAVRRLRHRGARPERRPHGRGRGDDRRRPRGRRRDGADGSRAACDPDVRRGCTARRGRGPGDLRRGGDAPRRRARGAARGRAVRPPAPAVGAVRRAKRRHVLVAGRPSPEPGDRRVQHRRERTDHVRDRLPHGTPGGPAGRRVRRPDGLHAADGGAGRRGGRGRGAAARRPDHRIGLRTWRARRQAARRRRAHQVRPLRRRRRRDPGGPRRPAPGRPAVGPRGRDQRVPHHARRRRVRTDRQHGRPDRRRGTGRAVVGATGRGRIPATGPVRAQRPSIRWRSRGSARCRWSTCGRSRLAEDRGAGAQHASRRYPSAR